MRTFFAFLISVYQKRISPHKGFICAHRGLHKGDSCSEYTKKQILEKGLLASIKTVRQRFNECRDAAVAINQRPPISQRGDCDLGLSGCDVSSCDLGGGGGGGSTSSGGSGGCYGLDCASSFDMTKRNFIKLLIALLIIVIISASLYYYFIGRQIESVDIRLKEDIEETSNSGAIAKIFRSQQPDYQINFDLINGLARTNTLKNKSAKNWISLKTQGSFYLTDISRMVIVNKELTRSKVLESIPNPQKKGAGQMFEYSIKQKWELF